MYDLIIPLTLIVLGYVAGTIAEKRHYKSIEKREMDNLKLPIVTFKTLPESPKPVKGTRLVTGNVVVSLDYFKRFLAMLRNIFGGEVRSYESLVDRARREAILRMVESAATADIIINMRIETSIIGQSANNRNSVGSIEVLAYGTAVFYGKKRREVHPQSS